MRAARVCAPRRRTAPLNGDDARASIAARTSDGDVRAAIGSVLTAHALLRIAGSATGVLIGLALANQNGGVRLGAADPGSAGTAVARSAVAAVAGSGGAAIAGSLGAASFAAELLASVPLGMAADALRPRLLMSAGAAAGAVAALLFAFAHSTAIFFTGRLLEGVGAAAVVPALLAYLADISESRPALRVRVMSFFELTLLAGLALGGIIAAQLFGALHAGAFVVIAIVYAVCAAILFASVGGRQIRHITDPIADLRAVFAIVSLRQLAPIWVCVNAIVGLWLGPTLPYLLTQRSTSGQFLAGIDAGAPARVGLVLFAYAVVFGSGIAIWSVVLPRLRLARAMRISLGAILPACALIFALNHSAQLSAPARWIEGGILVLFIMLESGFTPAALAWLAQTLPVQSGRAAAMGVYSVLLSVGAIVGSLLAALLGQRSAIDGLLAGTVLMTVIALLLLARLPDAALPAAGVHA